MKKNKNILIMVFFYITGSALAIGYLPWWGLGVVFAFGANVLYIKTYSLHAARFDNQTDFFL